MYITYIVFDTYKFITKEREGGGRALLSLSLTEFAVMLKNTKDALKKTQFSCLQNLDKKNVNKFLKNSPRGVFLVITLKIEYQI